MAHSTDGVAVIIFAFPSLFCVLCGLGDAALKFPLDDGLLEFLDGLFANYGFDLVLENCYGNFAYIHFHPSGQYGTPARQAAGFGDHSLG